MEWSATQCRVFKSLTIFNLTGCPKTWGMVKYAKLTDKRYNNLSLDTLSQVCTLKEVVDPKIKIFCHYLLTLMLLIRHK